MSDVTTSSLFERIKNRLHSNSDVILKTPTLGTFPNNEEEQEGGESDDESDIDDDITIEECAILMSKKKKENHFTNVKTKLASTRTDVNLRDVIAQRIEKNKSNIKICEKDFCLPVDENCSTLSTLSGPISSGCSTLSKDAEEIISSIRDSSSQLLNTETVKPHEKKKRKKLTDEEKKKTKEQKENEKLERQKQREKLRLEKELEKERQKAICKANTLNNRSERKDECMERMLAIVDPSLVQETGGADILKGLQELCVRFEMKTLPIPSCIGWMRENIDYSVAQTELTKSVTYIEEQHILHKLTANEVARRVEAQLNKLEKETLSDLITCLKDVFANKRITLVFFGMKAYYRFVKTKENQQLRNNALNVEPVPVKRKKKNKDVPLLQKKQIDNIIMQIQMSTDMSIRHCEDAQEFSMFVASITKAIAEAPFKATKETTLQFCVTAPSDKASVKISNDGNGLLQLWNQQLQQFYGVRHDTSVAITQVYPTPLSLIKMYSSMSPSEGEVLLKDIEIRRGVGVLQTRRRVGPELSKRIYKLLTSRDGDEALAR